LQSGVNIGVLGAVAANLVLAKAPPRCLFLVGILPALLVFWIRKAVPETEEWRAAKERARDREPGVRELFHPGVRSITVWVLLVCGVSLTAHWAFMFWHQQHLRNLPEVLSWTPEQKNKLVSAALYLVMAGSILGNFFAGTIARIFGYRPAIVAMCIAYFLVMFGAYSVPRDHTALLCWLPFIGFCQGVFALFTMYLPPLFPTLLRTTGAGFSYNIGRTIAAFGTIFFGLLSKVGDHRIALLDASYLFLPAAAIALFLPRVRD
jgi:MFS family permease